MITEAVKRKLREKYGDEEVLVCRNAVCSGIGDRFTTPREETYRNVARQSSFIRRCDAEYNPLFLQLISYIVVTNRSGQKFFVSRRKGGDERLRDTLAFFGGHINPCDMGKDTVMNAAIRELNEEVKCDMPDTLEYMGFVRDNGSPTSEHVGIVFQARVKKATIRETDNLEGEWMTKKDLFSHYNDFESWGRYILDYLYEEAIQYA